MRTGATPKKPAAPARKARPKRSFRLVDGLIVAAGALLVLKLVSFLSTPSQPDLAPDGLPRFAHVLAHARTNYPTPDPETTGSVPDKPKDVAAAPPAEPAVAPVEKAEPMAGQPNGSPAERAIRERLGERREELAQRSRDIETREKLLEEAERRAEARAEDARRSEETAARSGGTKEASALKGLVVMYETMKPKDAARVFDRLPLDVLVPIVRQIAPRKMAVILAAMSPEVAQKVTIALAAPAVAPAPGPVAALPPGELPAIEPAPRPAPRATERSN